jgi:Cu+-exporting ATPase
VCRMTIAPANRVGQPEAPGTADAFLDIDGLHCAACVGRVEAALNAQPGVRGATVNLAARRAHVTYVSGQTEPGALARAVEAAGYGATPARAPADHAARQRQEVAAARRQMLWAAALVLPVFVLEMGGHAVPALHHALTGAIGVTGWRLVQMALITAALAGPGRGFFVRGVPGLLRGAPDMDALVALGTGAAWLYSSLATLAPGLFPIGAAQVYFEAAGMIVLLILTGRWLEARARGRAGAAIARLAGLRPDTARVWRNGGFAEAPIAAIVPGDRLQIPPGALVPVDGVVTEGRSFLDESMLTGEPAPVARGPGDPVTGGTLNGAGVLEMRAERVGGDTVLARIIDMVDRAQGARLPVQAAVDRVTAVFVPIVLAIAALTVLGWLAFGPAPALPLALVAGVSVLIVACPCAMGLATPVAIMAGMGRAAELGVLFRKGDALQVLGRVRTLAFDKTGTLTEGRPALVATETATGWSNAAALRLAAAAEAGSEHPLARAILTAASESGLDLPAAGDVRVTPGLGLQARVQGRAVAIGNAALLDAAGVDARPLEAAAARMAAAGQTPVFLAVDGQLAAVLGIADPLRGSAAPALSRLRALGVAPAMLTGDRAETAHAVARQLGIADVGAGLMPAEKLARIDALKRAAGPVAFAGDGINDAPALAAADTGIAIGTGTDIAIEAAEVVLMSDDLRGVANAVAISRATMRTIRQNLFWAFAYNTALIPVAAGLLYPLTGTLLSPALAAGAMAASSLFVVANALRLRRVGARNTGAEGRGVRANAAG